MTVFFILGGALLLYAVFVIAFSLFVYFSIFRIPFYSLEYTLEKCRERGEFPPETLELPWENMRIYSPRRGAELAGQFLRGKLTGAASCPGTVIILHGRTWTRYGALKYARNFIEKSWNVVMYDLAGHGASGAGRLPVPSYGYDDKDDLSAVVDWVREKFIPARKLVLVGESLGAATVLQYAALDGAADRVDTGNEVDAGNKVDAVIADCSFSSMADEALAEIRKMRYPDIISRPALFLVSHMAKLRRGYTLEDISPYNAALKTPVPLLFIHGEDDSFIPASMSVRMARGRLSKAPGPTTLVLISGAGHAKSVLTDPEKWNREVFAFIDRMEVSMEFDKELVPGIRGETSAAVTPANTASAWGSGLLAVYATPAMVALMEEAAVAALKGRLPAGTSSVGTEISVKHLSATPVGMTVRASAELLELDKRRLVFKVEAFDAAGKIGEGKHERFIIDREKFMRKADEKHAQ